MNPPRKTGSPLIGVTPDVTSHGGSHKSRDPGLFLSQRYSQAIHGSGGVPIILPPNLSKKSLGRVLDHLQGILVTGGNFDIHPAFYGETPSRFLREIKQQRTEFELALIGLALDRDLPVLGVCGGQQAINVVLGGSLFQDIPAQKPQALEHEQKIPKDQPSHSVKIHLNTKLHRIVGCRSMKVNTTHHQAVKTTGRGLIANATAADGIIEGIESTVHRFVLGVQWHPESLMHRGLQQKKIFKSFVASCG